jgi:HD-GYP domain-containing protein (c-di-GMP phosphodiesterase class II)
MREISIEQINSGQKLAEQVTTSLGGSLLVKGHVLSDADIEVLQAFFIKRVMVETSTQEVNKKSVGEEKKTEVKEEEETKAENSKEADFDQEYQQVVKKTEKMFLNIQGGTIVPIIDIRQYLIPFVQRALQQQGLILTIYKLSNKNSYFYHHAVSVSILVSLLARKIGFDSKEIPQIALAGYLHNIGQLRIESNITNKPVALTRDEFQEIQNHPSYGYQMLKKASGISEGVVLAALQHHERVDGSGYPLGAKSGKTHPYARMVAIADIYYAMCSERMFKKAISPFLVIEQLKNDSFGKLDPTYVHHFLELITNQVTIGTKLKLSDGRLGEVVYIDKNHPTRPLVNCDGEMINLQQLRETYIDSIL